MLYNIIILPIETIIDWVFTFCFKKLSSFGIISCIFGVSIVINFLALPIYNIADKLQEKERNISNKLAPYVKRIKTAFKGDEQFMILQTYYRQNNYNPLYALRSSLSILIEIPFFIAAYHYLSHCDKLLGASFWIFKNLGAPDHFKSFSIASHTFYINILPILMTLINIISGIVYSRKNPLREQIQIYGIAIVFLALLYNSPSGLVIYWILNNLFSLIKNIVLKTKYPKAITFVFLSILFVLFTGYFWLAQPETPVWKKEVLTIFTLFFISIPFIISFIQKKCPVLINGLQTTFTEIDTKNQFGLFILAALSLCFLLGLYLPSGVISSSPIEFSYLGNIASPLYYIKSSFAMFLGICILWPCCIFFMFDKKVKSILPLLFTTLLFFTLGNIFIFKPDYKDISPSFEFSDNSFLYEIPKYFSLLPVLIILLVVSIYFVLLRKKKTFILTVVLSSILLAEIVPSFMKIKRINKSFKEYQKIYVPQKDITVSRDVEPLFHLSKDNKNVILLFLDRAVSSFFPYIMEQFPELETQFKGFTYYPNTLSYGRNTLNGFPPILGGYEYTPDNINKRKNELLKDKHNEALKVLPTLFSDADYSVTIAEPSMANYHWLNDVSIYDGMKNITATNITGHYTKLYKIEKNIKYASDDSGKYCNKNIKNFSILQGLYPPLRIMFYNTAMESGNYLNDYFLTNFSTLYYLDKLTDSKSTTNNFIFIGNDTPHSPIFLNETFEYPTDPIYTSAGNYEYHDLNVLKDYNVNAASMIQLGKFFEYLQKNDLYDNTRIVVVADHGCGHHYTAFDSFNDATIPSSYNPLLLFKDFASDNTKINIDNTFMTNADTLYLLKEGLNLSDINPYTGNKLIPNEKETVKVYPLSEAKRGNNPTYNMDNTQFMIENPCWEIKENIFDPDNWKQFNYAP